MMQIKRKAKGQPNIDIKFYMKLIDNFRFISKIMININVSLGMKNLKINYCYIIA